MKKGTKAKLKKWGIGVGCTLTAGLLLQGWKSTDAFAAAHQKALAAVPPQGVSAQSGDRVIDEWQAGRSGQAGGENVQGQAGTQPQGRHGERGRAFADRGMAPDSGGSAGGSAADGGSSGSFGSSSGTGGTGTGTAPGMSQQRTQPRSSTRAS
ncbi:hypothetical protein J31TS4_38180 [Paenibacillus sp. J31TS4]|uniref:hypothetical protein n=1 Tax=Paenibacillus sp. J31TS4 TaxID=2807195 RepID=UPI001B23BBE2|nr:hypothetical protein [Paenibacillus sp. J31TS4]GIP40538.1 hypothetical protein J31TS4_38180 [Paenibacillus sp. J31TS4]